MSYADEKYQRLVMLITSEMKQYFRPEFLNRLDEILIFYPLTLKEIKQINEILLNDLITRIYNNLGYKVEIPETTRDTIAILGFDPLYGARPLRRSITNLIENPLSNFVLENSFIKNTRFILTFVNENQFDLDIHVEPPLVKLEKNNL